VERSAVEQWVAAYEMAWRTAGTDKLVELFTDDVSYLPSPWAQPSNGLEQLGRLWESERDGPNEQFTMASDVVAVDEDTAVVRVSVEYFGTKPGRWRDLWVLRFAGDRRCAEFEEWPFAPDQRDGHEGPS
jgi:ketosteroid isomerase-like protein